MKIAIVIDSVPSYRRSFYRQLMDNPDIDLTVYCQSHVRGFNVYTIHKELGDTFVEVPFVSTPEHQAAWQSLPVRHLFSNFDVCFFHGNPRVVSSVVWGTLFRVLGKKIVIWGQAHTAGANPVTERIRLAWWRLFSNFLVYTDAEADCLLGRGFGRKRVVGMNNGLDQQQIDDVSRGWTESRLLKWQKERQLDDKTVLLSCARLVEKNRFDVMLAALPALADRYPDLVWAIIGKGSEHDALSARAAELGVSERIIWVGELYDEDALAPWFLSSEMLIHPGAIGLTLMHAFGYGLPVITHDNMVFHMPEIAAFEDGVNGAVFRQNDAASLADVIADLLGNRPRRNAMRTAAFRTVREDYNTRVMAERFLQIARTAYES
jgi:glycosyltransferase involved in cell wall biosynthesis